jgi:hypothetical protein
LIDQVLHRGIRISEVTIYTTSAGLQEKRPPLPLHREYGSYLEITNLVTFHDYR